MRKKTCYIRHSSKYLNETHEYYWDLMRDGGMYTYYALLTLSKPDVVKLRDAHRR